MLEVLTTAPEPTVALDEPAPPVLPAAWVPARMQVHRAHERTQVFSGLLRARHVHVQGPPNDMAMGCSPCKLTSRGARIARRLHGPCHATQGYTQPAQNLSHTRTCGGARIARRLCGLRLVDARMQGATSLQGKEGGEVFALCHNLGTGNDVLQTQSLPIIHHVPTHHALLHNQQETILAKQDTLSRCINHTN